MKKQFNFAFLAIFALAIAAFASPSFAAVLSDAAHQFAQFIGPDGMLAFGLAGTTLAADVARSFELGDRNHLPVIAADIIYEGAAVGDNGSGYARPLTAGDPFRGFAVARADNAAGAAGAKLVEVLCEGRVQLAVSGLAITDVGKPVYASDDATFTLTATSNSHVGRVIRWVSTGVGVIEFECCKGGLGSITALTDNSGGTAGDTIAAIGGTYNQAEVRNAVASLAAKINALQAQLK